MQQPNYSLKSKIRTLQNEWAGCTRCPLSALREGPVCFPMPQSPVDILFIMEGPTSDDMYSGSLLSGEDGELLTTLIAGEADDLTFAPLAITGCWPHSIIPATEDEPERAQGRQPNKVEVISCIARVHRAIYLLDPRLIIVFGFTALKALIPTQRDRGASVTTDLNAEGKIFNMRLPGATRAIIYPVMATVPIRGLMMDPSRKDHGPHALATKTMHRGFSYVRWLKTQERL